MKTCRYSLLLGQEVNCDCQEDDEYENPENDANHLIYIRQRETMSGFGKHAAWPAVHVFAAADQRTEFSMNKHEHERNFILIITDFIRSGHSDALKLTCKKVRCCLGDTCTCHRWRRKCHVGFHMPCVKVGLQVSPWYLQRGGITTQSHQSIKISQRKLNNYSFLLSTDA